VDVGKDALPLLHVGGAEAVQRQDDERRTDKPSAKRHTHTREQMSAQAHSVYDTQVYISIITHPAGHSGL